MKHYATFFYRNEAGGYSEACGDRSVLRLDGRWRLETMKQHANEWGRRLGLATGHPAASDCSNHAAPSGPHSGAIPRRKRRQP